MVTNNPAQLEELLERELESTQLTLADAHKVIGKLESEIERLQASREWLTQMLIEAMGVAGE